MTKRRLFVLAALVLSLPQSAGAARIAVTPETVVVKNGPVTLRGLLWRPRGRGPFPAILLNHGSGYSRQQIERLGPYEKQAEALGGFFAREGYVFLYLFRRGVGLSADQGASTEDLLNTELAAHGLDARNALQLELLQNREMGDALAGLALLRARPEVDARAIAAIGHSFGASLTLLMAEREPALRALVIFSPAGLSWVRSAGLRERLLAAVSRASMPIFFIHAENDYSVEPGKSLAARLQQLEKPHRLMIYPPTGHTAEEGHAFLYLRVPTWASDVLAFLREHLRHAVRNAQRVVRKPAFAIDRATRIRLRPRS